MQNETKTINVEMNISNNVTTMLRSINTKLSNITNQAIKAESAFSQLGANAAAFNNINTAVRTLSAAKTTLAVKQVLATKAMSKHFAVSKVLELSTSGLSAKTLVLTAVQGLATKQLGIMSAGKLLLAAAAKVAAGAMKAFGVAVKIMMGPIGWIIGAIGLLVAGAVALINRLNRCSDAARENAARLDELNKAAEQSAQRFERTQIAIDNQSNSANRLTDELERLSGIDDGNDRRAEIIAELTKVYGDLNHLIDEEGNLIEGSAEALRGYIRERRNTESFQNAIDRRNVLEAEHIDLLEGQRRAQAEVDRLREGSGRRNQRQLERAKETLDGFNDALAENNAAFQANADTLSRSFTSAGESIDVLAEQWGKTVDEVEQAMDRYGFTLDDMVSHQEAVMAQQAELMAQQKTDLVNLADEWGMCVDDIIAEMEKYDISMDEWAANQQRAWEDTQASIRQHTGNIINNFRELPSALEQCAGEMADILYRNRQIYNEWQQNLSRASATLNADVVRELESMGTASNQIMNDLFDFDPETATEAQREAHYNAKRLVAEIEAGIQDATAHATGTIETVGEETGETYVESVINGTEGADYTRIVRVIENATESTIAVAAQGGEETGEAYVDGVTAALGAVDFTPVVDDMDNATRRMTNSTRQAMTVIKSVTAEAMTFVKNSIYDNMTQAVINARNGLTRITAMFNGLRTSLPVSLFEAGSRAMEGMQLGMISREPSIVRTAQQIAENVTRIMRSALQIGSPSRVLMRLGDSTMKGFAIGMERMQDRVKRIVNDTAYMVKDGLDKALAESQLQSELTVVTTGANATATSNLLQSIRDEIKAGFEAGQVIVLDSGELVGATYGQIDSVSGTAISYSNRWGR
jgi:hypothetical protein